MVTTSPTLDDDKIQQLKLGYDSHLRKGLSYISSASFGFNTIALLTGLVTVYGHVLTTGGPTILLWGWIGSFFMTMIVSLCMAEICAAFPACGGVYNWCAQVVPKKQAPLASYICGWFYLFGGIILTALGCAVFAGFLNASIIISSGNPLSMGQQVGVAIGSLAAMSLLNIGRIDEIGLVNELAGIIHLCTCIIIIIVLFVLPYQMNSLHDVVYTYHNETGFSDMSYVCAIGLIGPAYVFTGYDASAQLAEETTKAKKSAPRAILSAVFTTGIVGLCMIFALLFATLDIDAVLDGPTDYAVMNTFYLYLSRPWAVALAWLLVINAFFANFSFIGVASRLIFALARDNGLPFSTYLSTVDETFRSPVRAVCFTAFFSIIILLFLLDPNTNIAFQSMVGLAVIGLQVSYALPILLKFIYQPADFPTTPFSLGYMSSTLGFISCIYLLGISTLAFLPAAYPVNIDNMNWTVVVFAGFALIGFLNWIFNSRHYFEGPKRFDEDFSATTSHSIESSDGRPWLSESGNSTIIGKKERRLSANKDTNRSLRLKWFLPKEPAAGTSTTGSKTPSQINVQL